MTEQTVSFFLTLCLGKDQEIADVYAKFDGRTMVFGDGLMINSPSDLRNIIGVEKPTEDDVLHAPKLPTYDNTLRYLSTAF